MKTIHARWLKRATYITFALGALVAYGCESPRSEHASSESATPISVVVHHVTPVDLPSHVEAGGIVQAGATAHVTSRIVAPIQEVHVRTGDRVTRGQRLVTLDSRELTANAARASAALAAATEAARAAESRTATAEAGLRLAGATHSRIKSLHDKRSATPQELDQAVAGLSSAEAQVQAARAESAAAIAARDAAKAAADASSVAGSYAVVVSPFDGVVAERRADPGSLAAPGSPLLVIEQSGPVRLEVRLDESRAGWVATGQQAEVRLDADTKGTWRAAKVVEVGRADPASHSFLVKIELPPGTVTRTGGFGRARFAGQPRRTLAVPSSSVVRRAGLSFVFAIDRDSLARLRPVVTGAIEGDRTEVLAGVGEGDVVVVSPPPSLTDGSRVNPGPAQHGEAAAAQESGR